MRPWWGLLALCACNQVLGIDRTTHPLDGRIDGPFSCPAIGQTPQYDGTPQQLVPRDCQEYTLSTASNLAVAYCFSQQGSQVEQGAVNGDLNSVPELAPVSGISYAKPRLSPEGDQLVVIRFGTSADGFVRYRRSGSSWTADAAPFVMPAQITANDQVLLLSTASRGPDRHLLALVNHFSSASIDEMTDDGSGTLGFVKEYTPAILGLDSGLDGPMLSPDGLRAVFRGQAGAMVGVWLVDRPSITSDFGPPRLLSGIPDVTDPFLTEDCGRVYYSTAGSIWYAQQL